MSEHVEHVEHGHPPLTDPERGLLCHLAIQTICAQTGEDEQAIADALDELASRGLISIWRDATDAYLCVGEFPLVRAERSWLHVVAHRGDPVLN